MAIHPVIRSDLAGTNFVLQEYCIHEQPAMWRAFVTSPAVVNNPAQVGDLSPTDPRSDWPIFTGGIEASGSAPAANDVAAPNNNGYITAVETAYALQRNYPNGIDEECDRSVHAARLPLTWRPRWHMPPRIQTVRTT